MHALQPCVFLLVSALVVVAAAYDLRYRRIPNWLNLSGALAGFVANVSLFHLHGLVTAMEGLLLAAAVYFPFYLLRGMGAGDVKLMAAIGAIVGPFHWLTILIATGVLGGAAGATYALLKGRLSETCCNVYFLVKDLLLFRAPYTTNPELDFRSPGALRMPHGVIIASGCLAVFVLDITVPNWVLHLP
jgi:prepilin peptidase CpaA